MSVIAEEIKKFTSNASKWWSLETSPFLMLHKINPARLSYITNQIKSHYNFAEKSGYSDLKILDVGCGGGLCSIPLAKLGAQVLGIDAGIENIEAAKKRSDELAVKANFQPELIENIQGEFDIIICLEVLEHVNNYKEFFSHFSRLLKKNGILIVSTINRTIKSKIVAIYIAEYIAGLLPKKTHDWNKFLRPSDLVIEAEREGFEPIDISGITFDLLKQDWVISKDIDINYIASFLKLSD
ncbi:MAG: bifunctional 2-polyprenyl-6-hydroxyphenol methylase/3-demethylubiquinol 3-O-methyltransferase UbiG [Alphaproteobacteria bacterium]|nr:bifunctional 2-polyprenyl-6-hydroxyphenol methylase/3-demethylubiquinol 3-O-methyltransferase UbiG [Alphaproteobacteria bacterium]